MSDLLCPVCGKPNPQANPNAADPKQESGLFHHCQYCGANLKQDATTNQTSDLPDWLKDMHRLSSDLEPGSVVPISSNPPKQEPGLFQAQPANAAETKKPDSASFPDYLAGLSNLGDDEDDESPDWLNNLQGILPTPPLIQPTEPKPAQPGLSVNELVNPVGIAGQIEPAAGSQQSSAFQSFDSQHAESQAADSNADWLKAFDLPNPASGPVPAGGQDVPDAEIDPATYADMPDWLANLAGASGQSVPSQSPVGTRTPEQTPVSSHEPVDWLSSLGSDFGEFTAEDNFTAAEASTPVEGEAPDWIARMGADSSAVASPSADESSPAPIQPDWLSSLSGSAFPVPEPTGLSGLSQDGAQEDQESPALLTSDDELSDWSIGSNAFVAGQDGSKTPDVAAQDDLPDWMASLRGSAPFPAQVEPTGLPGNSHDDTPDWLAHLQGSPLEAPVDSTPAQVLSEPFSAAAVEDVPDWLANLQGFSASGSANIVPPQALSETPAATSHEGFPDWMSSVSVPSTIQKPDEPQNQSQPFDADFMAEFLIPGGTGELPDWLAKVSQAPAADAPQTEPAAVPHSNSVQKPTDEAPGTTRAESSQLPVKTGTVPSDLPSKSNQDSSVRLEIPSLIPDVDGQIQQNIDSAFSMESTHDLLGKSFSMETPDWLSNFLPTAAQPPIPVQFAEQTEPTGLPGLPPALVEKAPPAGNLPTAELPSWVQALRPMESVVVETSDSGDSEEVENEGPLAGLRSVLPTQSGLLGNSQKSYAHEFLTSETQQAQAALLENLIKSEKNPRGLPKRAKNSRMQPLRWGIAAALLVIILIFAALGSKVFPTPAAPMESAPTGMFFNVVANLPDNAPVLIVMDYQPGYAGELESALGPVMEHLMSKNTRLAFVSTSPMGDLMVERLLSKFAGSYPYQAGLQYVALGYLPGGAGGIKIFADQPAVTVGQDMLSGNLWDTPVLKDVTVNSITSLSNFAAVIVATDNPEIGRLWIEQTQPALGSKPMLMVVSAQAEPMIQPYLQSRQIMGLVAGLEGGLMYESARGKPGQARTYWDAYSAAILIAVFIILIGGVWSLRGSASFGRAHRRDEMEQDEA